MITLRILLTGLIAYGPMAGINEETTEVWALMARADTVAFPHKTEIRFDCDVDGLNCAKTFDLAGYDLRILVDHKALTSNKALRIDYSFREFMGNLDEIAGDNSYGHLACSGLVTARRLPPMRTPLETVPELLQRISGSTIPKNIDKVASRLRLTGGFPLLAGRCDGAGATHCGGKLAAKDVAVCGLWKFPVAPNPRCTRLADTVVYELQVEASDLRFARVSHTDGAIIETPDNLIGSQKVVEVWVVNAPENPPSSFGHFQRLYDLFTAGQLPKASIPTYNENGIAQCIDLPGLRPVKCPGMVF